MQTDTKNRQLPANFWQTAGLTLKNFSDKAEELTGSRIRFRRTKDQVARGLDREQAFAETFASQNKPQ